MIYVTHDQEEAMTLGDRIAVLRAGRLEQLAPPLEVYRRPATRFVADFIGTPSINWLEGRIERAAGALAVTGKGFRVELPGALASALAEGAELRDAALGVRPQDLTPCAPGEADVSGRVDLVEALGSALLVHVRAEGEAELRVLIPADEAVAEGDTIALRLRRDRLHLFDAERGTRIDEQPESVLAS